MKKSPGEYRNERGGSLIDEQLILAARILSQGGIVALPTETCYGLAVAADNEKALARLFQIKKRPSHKPVLLLIHDISLLKSLVSAIPEAYISLIEKYWPGPLTLIFPARPELSVYLTGGTRTVGIRISSHPQAMALGRLIGKAITATSANLSGQTPGQCPSDVMDSFGENIDYVIDGGRTPAGLCSTIISLHNDELCLLRSGAIEVAGVKTKLPFSPF